MNKKIWITIGIIILVTIGWFFYSASKKQYVCWPYCPEMTDEDREKIKESALDASIKNWKTFKNGGFDFAIKYPSDWIVVENYAYLDDFHKHFCPPELIDKQHKTDCKSEPNPGHIDSPLAPIAFVQEPLSNGIPTQKNNNTIWVDESAKMTYSIYILDESYREIYEKMVRSVKLPSLKSTN